MQGSKERPSSRPYRERLSRLFSEKVEDSLRLRLLALATFWLVAIAVAWVGGSPWVWLGGGIATTCGHAFSWHRKHRRLGVWPVVIALALVMRVEILASLEGNWLPFAHFLLLVQTVASFCIRTRGGLYGGLALSGIVLFFASQQAFELSFSVFLLGYAALLIAFLATAFLEDETEAAQVQPASKGLPLVGFWSATAAAVLLLSVAAFLLLPRGESNAVGYQQVSALPITGDPGGAQPEAQVRSQGSAEVLPGGEPQPSPSRSSDRRLAGEALNSPLESPEYSSGQGIMLESDAFTRLATSSDGDEVVMHVRSPVASYWRGQVFDNFDGRTWHLSGSGGLESGPMPGSHPSYVPENAISYTQTYFIRRAQSGTTFMGYRGVEVLSPEEALYLKSAGKGFSYKVVSVQPELVPERLRQDMPGRAEAQYYSLPSPRGGTPSMGSLPGLADQITAGAGTGFDRAVSIVDFLRRNGQYDASTSNQLESSAPLDALLLDGEPGTSIDFATATVMLARAAGLPARLAVGYLPGERDLLSGAYTVRERDAHAWAEILFREHGWVPFDGTPRPDLYTAGQAGGGQLTGLKHLFESSVGDDLLRAAVVAPSRLSSGLKDAFNSPAITALAAVASGAILATLVWISVRLMWKGRRRADKRWPYSRLSGGGRDEMLRIYSRVERLLRKKGIQARKPGQTLREYARTAAEQMVPAPGVSGVKAHLDWFTEAAWAAAYSPSGFPMQMAQEAKTRLSSLEMALG